MKILASRNSRSTRFFPDSQSLCEIVICEIEARTGSNDSAGIVAVSLHAITSSEAGLPRAVMSARPGPLLPLVGDSVHTVLSMMAPHRPAATPAVPGPLTTDTL